MYFVGIDGGGSKTDFKAVDESGRTLRLTLNKGCKPGYFGVERAVAVLREGLDSLRDQLDQSILAIYAGIAGCNVTHALHQPILDCLKSYTDNCELEGDLRTGFRALSSKPYGVALLCGSGSSIAHWYPDGAVHLDAVSYGAREIIFLLSNAYKQKQFDHETSELLRSYIGPDLIGKNAHYFLTHGIPMDVLKQLDLSQVTDDIWQNIAPVFDIVIERWAFKAIGRILWHQSRTDERPTEIALVGGVWNFSYIREAVLQQLHNALGGSATIRFDPIKLPVDGAVQLAMELVVLPS